MAFVTDSLNRFFVSGSPQENEHDNEQVLKDAIGNSMLLVMTASEIAVPLDETVISTIIATKNAFESKTLETELESNFWAAYEKVAQDLKPVTIDSIKATYDPNPTQRSFIMTLFSRKKIPLSRKCASNYKLLSLITLVLLISIQIYWYIGWSLTSDIIKQAERVGQLNTQLTTLINQDVASAAQTNLAENIENTSKITNLRREIVEHSEWKDAAATHLVNWNDVWSSMDLLTLQPWQVEGYDKLAKEVRRRIQFVSAKNTLKAIAEYILPILYGLIGACFYILRQLPKEIESLTFSMNSYIDYSLRMAQGPLAGMMVSYFFSTSQNTEGVPITSSPQIQTLDASISSLSPLAVAFLAGYSVEFIFRFIDKILSSPSFDGKNNPEKPKKSQKQ